MVVPPYLQACQEVCLIHFIQNMVWCLDQSPDFCALGTRSRCHPHGVPPLVARRVVARQLYGPDAKRRRRPFLEAGFSMSIATTNPTTGEVLKRFDALTDLQIDAKIKTASE